MLLGNPICTIHTLLTAVPCVEYHAIDTGDKVFGHAQYKAAFGVLFTEPFTVHTRLPCCGGKRDVR